MMNCERCGLPAEHDFESDCVQAQYEVISALRAALTSVDGHLRAIIVYAKSGSELENTARDACKVVETALGPSHRLARTAHVGREAAGHG